VKQGATIILCPKSCFW